VVKRYVEKSDYDPAAFAAHSCTRELAMNQTGHRSVTSVRRYIRDGNLFRENAVNGIRLDTPRMGRTLGGLAKNCGVAG
jgi:hypothetical protein